MAYLDALVGAVREVRERPACISHDFLVVFFLGGHDQRAERAQGGLGDLEVRRRLATAEVTESPRGIADHGAASRELRRQQ